MALSGTQKTMIKMGVKQLTKWMKTEKEGRVDLSLKDINTFLIDEGYDAKILIKIVETDNGKETKVRLQCL